MWKFAPTLPPHSGGILRGRRTFQVTFNSAPYHDQALFHYCRSRGPALGVETRGHSRQRAVRRRKGARLVAYSSAHCPWRPGEPPCSQTWRPTRPSPVSADATARTACAALELTLFGRFVTASGERSRSGQPTSQTLPIFNLPVEDTPIALVSASRSAVVSWEQARSGHYLGRVELQGSRRRHLVHPP